MADEPNAQATPAPDTQDVNSTASVEPSRPAIQNPEGLLNAYERLKAENSELKALKAKADILTQIEQGGIPVEQLPGKLAELRKQAELDEQFEKRTAELKAQAEAEQKGIEQRYLDQLRERDEKLNAIAKTRQIESVLAETGATMSAYGDFEVLASRYIDFDENNQIKGFKTKDGETFYVDDEKQSGKVRLANIQDFVIAAKKGAYGPALQSLLPAYNQSAGSGIPSSGGVGGDGYLVFTQQEMDNPEFMSKLTNEQLAKVRAREYRVI